MKHIGHVKECLKVTSITMKLVQRAVMFMVIGMLLHSHYTTKKEKETIKLFGSIAAVELILLRSSSNSGMG
jgi:hypothetical protein